MRALVTVQKLIALALCPTAAEGEASNAALAAVRLMGKHGLSVGVASSVAPEPDPCRATDWKNPEPRRTRTDDDDPAHEAAPRSAAPKTRSKRAKRTQRGKPAPATRPPTTQRTRIVSHFNAACGECREPYFIGDWVFWARGGGCLCAACNEALSS